MTPGVFPYSIPARVLLQQMPVVVNRPAIPNEETPAPAQVMEDIPIAETQDTIETNMDFTLNSFEACAFQLSKANEPRYIAYQTARVYANQAEHPPPHTPLNFPPPNAPKGPAYY